MRAYVSVSERVFKRADALKRSRPRDTSWTIKTPRGKLKILGDSLDPWLLRLASLFVCLFGSFGLFVGLSCCV